MFHIRYKFLNVIIKRSLSIKSYNKNSLIDVSDEVTECLTRRGPVVALESTIITHGMPYPTNIECALKVEEIVRKEGAVPATIAIINGRIKVGLTHKDIEYIGNTKVNSSIKTSRRDFPFVLSKKLNGGTTVSGTIIVANKVGIPIFVTGGIGGVHRLGENTMDISADLTELGRNNVAVISSGVKSILDIPRTLEYLETQGVGMAVFGESKDFPAFYTRKSGSQLPYNLTNSYEAAKFIFVLNQLELRSGILVAVPVPEEHALDANLMENAINQALIEARSKSIVGKEITPFLLEQISNITKGKSLKTNIALIQNNAKVGAQIAVAYSKETAKLREVETDSTTDKMHKSSPVIIGGAVVDSCAKIKDGSIKLDGSTHPASISLFGGGVGRNICEAMTKLGSAPKFLSVIGDDLSGNYLENLTPFRTFQYVQRTTKLPTAQYTVVLDRDGECKLGIGDMDIHELITPELVLQNEDLIRNSPLLILDGNISIPTIDKALQLAEKCKIPVFFEPTDIRKAGKIFSSAYSNQVTFISPNLAELRSLVKSKKISYDEKEFSTTIDEALYLSLKVVAFIPTIIVTLGAKGVLIVTQNSADHKYFNKQVFQRRLNTEKIQARLYPTEKITDLINVSGAGDCWISGFITAMLEGLSEERCAAVGFASAKKALFSLSAVPKEMFDRTDKVWNSCQKYVTLI